MKATHNTRKSCALIGLLVAFLVPAVFPAFTISQDVEPDGPWYLSASANEHLPQGLPLQLLGEAEEEESRTDKQHAFILPLPNIVFEKSSDGAGEPTSWAFNHTNSAALSDFPIYLAQKLLLI